MTGEMPAGPDPEISNLQLMTLGSLIFSGNFSTFMQKEIFEQPESVVNTMRGRINFELEQVGIIFLLQLNSCVAGVYLINCYIL